MQSALAVGILLQNRYRVARLLGQGGFGRTYLAKDQGRFEEDCVIKEFMPLAGSDRFSSKAAQLFQREAEILYQISHPQIPQFRATFEQDQRLFLVQDYIEGLTYRDILQQRPGQAFSETEIRAFLGQLLPVLAHIHAKGIIHRDISPDNIILRRSDQKPVLIDFGVVKEVVTRLQTEATVVQATTVGKAGYAPSEQLQSGRAYPSSDLYALAVTVIVLLTAKEPHELFDDISLSWNWRSHTQVSDALAAVLDKALSYRPSDRYQSVSDISRALQQGGSVRPEAVASVPPPAKPVTQQPPVSEMRTVAVGSPVTQTSTRPEISSPKVKTYTKKTQVVTSQKQGKDSPLALTAMFAGAVALAGFGGWATVNYVVKPDPPEQSGGIQPLPLPDEIETIDQQPGSPEAEPLEPDNRPTNYASDIELTPGSQKTVEGGINRGDTVSYRFAGKAGQTLRTSLAGEGVVLSVLDPEGKELRGGRRVADWQGELPEDGAYSVQVLTTRGTEQGTYQLSLNLVPAAAGPEAGDTDGPEDTLPEDELPADNGDNEQQESPDPVEESSEVQEQILSQRVQFPDGETGTLRSNSVGPGRVQRYVVNAQQQQIMTVRIVQASGPVTFDVLFPGGEPMADAEGVLYWNSYLPLGGDYQIDVRSPSTSEFTLDIQVVGSGTEE
ncbi:MAG: serine/threonine-protein kinase [Cyanobacteria bacterium P01_D01_bin.156]